MQLGHYVPYTHLTVRGRLSKPQEDNSLLAIFTGTNQGLDRAGEHAIDYNDWVIASKAVEELVRKHHGDMRADSLCRHHHFVSQLSSRSSWEVALLYDISVRELAVGQPQADIGTPNHHIMLDAQARVNQAQLNRAMEQATRHALRARDEPVRTYTPSRRPARDEEGPRKRPRQAGDSRHCFRCGYPGHYPATCTAANTITGRAAAPLSTTSASPNALAAPNGKPFCFTFARGATCSHGSQCVNHHACSVCGAADHGAARCNRV